MPLNVNWGPSNCYSILLSIHRSGLSLYVAGSILELNSKLLEIANLNCGRIWIITNFSSKQRLKFNIFDKFYGILHILTAWYGQTVLFFVWWFVCKLAPMKSKNNRGMRMMQLTLLQNPCLRQYTMTTHLARSSKEQLECSTRSNIF